MDQIFRGPPITARPRTANAIELCFRFGSRPRAGGTVHRAKMESKDGRFPL